MTKQKLINGFHEKMVQEWENNDGVNFAIALSRITGWLLHVDWYSEFDEDNVDEKLLKSLRVYVGLDENIIFDFLGKKQIGPWAEYVIMPIVYKRKLAKSGVKGGVLTRYYSEEKLNKLPLRVKSSEKGIEDAHSAILKNISFLNLIPPRLNPEIPAHIAAKFTYGWCVVFAEVLKDLFQFTPTAIVVKKYNPQLGGGRLGFCHSIIMHPDGEVEDSWGKQPLQKVLDKYGIVEYSLSTEDHIIVSDRLSRNSSVKYKECYDLAKSYLFHNDVKGKISQEGS